MKRAENFVQSVCRISRTNHSSENKTNLIDESNDLYNYIENPKMEGDTLVFTIKNPPITGKYQLNIKKVHM